MAGLRELLAIGLGVGLGVGLLLAPRTAIRLSVFNSQHGHRGEYGADEPIPERWVWVVRVLGLACIAVAAVIGFQIYA
jgi:hypothetical protein